MVRDDQHWGSWADWLDVPRHTMSALVGAVTALGLDNADAIRVIRPGIDLQAAYKAGSLLRELDLPVDAIATSGEWGVAKPDAAFFDRVVKLAGVAPGETLYVGDQPELMADVNEAVEWRPQSQYVRLSSVFPGLIAELVRGLRSRPELAPLLAAPYRAADAIAYKCGYLDLSARPIDLMRQTSMLADDALLRASVTHGHRRPACPPSAGAASISNWHVPACGPA